MLEIEAIPTPIEKLQRLEEFLLGEQPTVYKFGRYLAERFKDETAPDYPNTLQGTKLLPMGFVLGVHLAIYDLQTGVNGFTNEPIKNELVSLPEAIYPTLSRCIPTIAEAIYQKDFAEAVKSFYDETNQAAKEVRDEEPKTPEIKINHTAVIPGKDPFDMIKNGERIPDKGILVSAKILKGSNAVFSVYSYDNFKYRLEDSDLSSNFQRMDVSFNYDQQSKQLDFGFEDPNYPGKSKEPFNRSDPSTYIPTDFGQLDIVSLPISQGRLLVAKEANLIGNLGTYFDKNSNDLKESSPRRDVLTYLEPGNFVGMQEAIIEICTNLIGLNTVDAIIMANNAWDRLDPEGFKAAQEESIKRFPL